MLYEKKREPLTREIFEHPPKEYRGAPFWAWNTAMTEVRIESAMNELKDMGMGGAHLHSRTGMNISYLSEEFFTLVKKSLKTAQEKELLLWLYDEDRWPSGFGGGMVTKNHAFRSRFLVFSPVDIEGKEFKNVFRSSARPYRSLERTLLRCFEVRISEKGWLTEYRVIEKSELPRNGCHKWYAYMEVSADNPWFNNQAYLDTLKKEAVDVFIQTVYERYFKQVGNEFGKTIPAIFTDEPQFCHKQRMGFANGLETAIIPYTEGLEDTFLTRYGTGILDFLPELFWEKGEDTVSLVRYRYHDVVCECFTRSYAVNIGAWCREHGIMLTGHMMEEPTLMSQTAALGEAMRSYQAFELPGIDMLCDRRELTTAKQAASAAHQYGREGVLSELYGVTNWDFDFRGHKLQGDWQAALGVTVRVHHLNWSSMKGEAKRDYPAAIGYQSPWYLEYPFVEDHFARLNTALIRGVPMVRIGVIHPIESYWLYWGTEEKTSGIREELEEGFGDLTKWLLFGLLDFDFISESLLPDLQPNLPTPGEGFVVGQMKYDVIVVPNCMTLRETTIDRLMAFAEGGGTVIVTGADPRFMDGAESGRPQELMKVCHQVPFGKRQLLNAMEEFRLIDVVSDSGIRTDNLISQFRKDKNEDWLFLAHVYPMANPDLPVMERNTVRVKGYYEVTEYDTLNGVVIPVSAHYENGMTVVRKEMYGHDSLLLKFEKRFSAPNICPEHPERSLQNSADHWMALEGMFAVGEEFAYTLSEPNVLILDMASYRLDEEVFTDTVEEILRIDNRIRNRLGYPLRMEAFAQPWTDARSYAVEHTLSLKYHIFSELSLSDLTLAAEDATELEFILNGETLSNTAIGWYTDRDIQTIAVPELKKGNNELIVRIPYHQKRNVEAFYLLGSFGVWAKADRAVLTQMPDKLQFGDLTRQGFPFYGGNVTYQADAVLNAGEYALEICRFRSPVIGVSVDGKRCGPIAYAPYRCELKNLASGTHRLEITAFGSRINTFGTLHNCNEKEPWYGPNAWRTEEAAWSYEYVLKETGILKAPLLYRKETKEHEREEQR